MVGYEYSQDTYDSNEPFDDSNFLDILTRGEGHTNMVDTSSYEQEPEIQAPPNSADKPDTHPL